MTENAPTTGTTDGADYTSGQDSFTIMNFEGRAPTLHHTSILMRTGGSATQAVLMMAETWWWSPVRRSPAREKPISPTTTGGNIIMQLQDRVTYLLNPACNFCNDIQLELFYLTIATIALP